MATLEVTEDNFVETVRTWMVRKVREIEIDDSRRRMDAPRRSTEVGERA